MGSVFIHVADAALCASGDDPCQHCDRPDVPVYSYFGEIIDPERANDPELARQEPTVHELCADCILGGNIRRDVDDHILKMIEQFASDRDQALVEFQQLPEIPMFLQSMDWPICCGRWCEFVGAAASFEELVQRQALANGWHHGPTLSRRLFAEDGPPESLDEISFFRCHTCGKQYEIDQFT